MELVAERHGWALYRYDGPEGRLSIAHRTPEHPDHDTLDELAAETLHQAAGDPKAMAYFQALVVRLVELDGRPGGWCWQRGAELVYGPQTDHPERTLPPLRAWMAVLARVAFDLGLAKGSKRRQRAKPGDPPLPDYGLVRLEMPTCALPPGRCRHRGTVYLSPTVGAALRADLAPAPADTLRLSQPGLTNPEGRRPNRGTYVRAKVAALWVARGRSPDPDRSRERGTPVVRLTIEELLTTYGGVDVAPFRRRRMQAALYDCVVDALKNLRVRAGVGISRVPLHAHDALAVELEIEGCPADTSSTTRNGSGDRLASPTATPVAAQRHPSGPVGPRGPPR